MSATIETLRERLQQLKARHDRGEIGAEAYEQARQPLERELGDEVTRGGLVSASGSPWRLRIGLAAGALVVAVAGYSITGSPGRAGLGSAPVERPAIAAEPRADAPTNAQVAEVIDRMVQRLKDRPDDAAGWALLARAYVATGRPADAVPAFQKAAALDPEDAGLLADHAEALVMLNDGGSSPEAIRLIEQALLLDPDQLKARALSGAVAFENRDYAMAVHQWERVERGLPPDSAMLPELRATIAEARKLAGLPPATSVVPAGGRALSVSGTVTLAPELAARVSPDDVVFVFARAANGMRMPLAVLRKKVKDLPLQFTLDDDMAMSPGARISDHAQVVVSARISRTGNAQPQPDDPSGQSAAVAPGTDGIVIQIAEAGGR